MKERSLIMPDSDVRATLDGRKTQFRRVVKPQPSCPDCGTDCNAPLLMSTGFWTNGFYFNKRCPYGQPGDRLWVREAWNNDWTYGTTLYRADGGSAKEAGYESEPKWRQSNHMPQELSRITLEVTTVRVEQLQKISDADVRAEGVPDREIDKWLDWLHPNDCAGHAFGELWNSINAKHGFGWDTNPWVFVVDFKRIEQTS